MTPETGPETTLDEQARSWLGGDESAGSLLFENLRVRLLSVAKRRVQPDHLEDLVQEALQIVLKKAVEQQRSENVLVWSLAILRNVVGNHYQARRRERERMVGGENILDTLADGAAAPDSVTGTGAVLEQALREMAERFPRCGRIFAGILAGVDQGDGPRDISQRALESVQREWPEMTRGAFYTALHRCRSQLRAILDSIEKEPRHD